MNRFGVALAGNWIVDRVKTIDVYPDQDALANVESVQECNGGSPYNVAVDLVRMEVDLPLFACGLVGNDAAGYGIREHLGSLGLNTAYLSTTGLAGTAFTDVMAVRSTGRRTFFHYRGANAYFDGEAIDFDALPARIFHLGYLLLLDALDAKHGAGAARLLARASAAGLQTSVDLVSEDSHRFASIVSAALPHVDYLFANEFELSRTTGLAIGESPTEELVRKAAMKLFGLGLRRALLLHTPKVSFAVHPDGTLHRQPAVAVPLNRIVNAVGAGDAFAAGALSILHDTENFGEALQRGVAVAAASLQHATTSLGVERWPDCVSTATAYGYYP